jgi:hypothetical protein
MFGSPFWVIHFGRVQEFNAADRMIRHLAINHSHIFNTGGEFGPVKYEKPAYPRLYACRQTLPVLH